LAVNGVEVFDDVVRFVVCVTVLDDLTSGSTVCNGGDCIVSNRPNAPHVPSFVRTQAGK